MKKSCFLLSISIALLFAATNISAQSKVNVKFVKGANSATFKGSITGDKYIDYIFAAKAGQTASIESKSTNPNIEYLVYDSAMNTIEDSNGGGKWSDALPVDGSYTIRVILPRSEARRKGARANFSIAISVK